MRPMAGTVSSGPGWSRPRPTSSPWPATRPSRATPGPPADVLAAHAPDQAWKRRSCGNGAKGPRVFDWAAATLPGGQRAARWSRPAGPPLADPQRQGRAGVAYYLCCAPAGTTDEELIRVAGSRWAVEECFQTAKNETGLDHYQVRRYDPWYRHITLAMLAHAYLAVTAATAPKALAAASSRSRSARSAVSWHPDHPVPAGPPHGPGPTGEDVTSTAPRPATTSEDKLNITNYCRSINIRKYFHPPRPRSWTATLEQERWNPPSAGPAGSGPAARPAPRGLEVSPAAGQVGGDGDPVDARLLPGVGQQLVAPTTTTATRGARCRRSAPPCCRRRPWCLVCGVHDDGAVHGSVRLGANPGLGERVRRQTLSRSKR